MAYSNEVINKVLVRLAKDISINKVSKEFNISKTTIYRWKKANKDLIEEIEFMEQIRKLLRKNKYEEARELTKDDIFPNNPHIQSQRINILITLINKEKKRGNKYKKINKYYNEMLEICNKDVFVNKLIIQFQKQKIITKRKKFLKNWVLNHQ